MRCNKILILLRREYAIVTRKKLFWIVSIAGPLAYLLLIVGLGFAIGGLQKGQKVRVYDGAGLGPGMRETMEKAKLEVEVLPRPDGAVPTGDLLARKLDVIIDVPKDLQAEPAAQAPAAASAARAAGSSGRRCTTWGCPGGGGPWGPRRPGGGGPPPSASPSPSSPAPPGPIPAPR